MDSQGVSFIKPHGICRFDRLTLNMFFHFLHDLFFCLCVVPNLGRILALKFDLVMIEMHDVAFGR